MSRAATLALAVGLVAFVACRDAPPAPAADTRITPATIPPAERLLKLPNTPRSIRFAVIGDAGSGELPQYEVSARMQAFRRVFPFDFVIMAGDNVYDGGTREDYRRKFELPYKPLLDAGVTFHAAIGNHDDPNQPDYAPFHMGGERYYTFAPDAPGLLARDAGVRFFVLDTESPDRLQMAWLERELSASDAVWKIAVFHRPLYTSGRYGYGARDLRRIIEPVLVKHDVAVVISGHEHLYERTKPQRGITYFTSGGAGKLRVGDLRRSAETAVGFDRDFHFMLFEIDGDALYYQAISRAGLSIDSGVIRRPAHLTPAE
jgi:3',5'-cyclic AMP phosphodiesterase CpdA